MSATTDKSPMVTKTIDMSRNDDLAFLFFQFSMQHISENHWADCLDEVHFLLPLPFPQTLLTSHHDITHGILEAEDGEKSYFAKPSTKEK